MFRFRPVDFFEFFTQLNNRIILRIRILFAKLPKLENISDLNETKNYTNRFESNSNANSTE